MQPAHAHFVPRLHRSPGRRPTRAGLTLIELLVSVGILVIMLLAFGVILTGSQEVVARSQATMRSNSAAAAIADVIRNDLRQATKNGFLCIMQDPADPNGNPILTVMTAGVSESGINEVVGTARLVSYGICDNQADPNEQILWRKGWVLAIDPNNPDPNNPRDDVIPSDYAVFQQLPRYIPLPPPPWSLDSVITTYISRPEDITIPPQQLSDIDTLWQCLAVRCSELSIMWTDGEPKAGENNVPWYGLAHDGTSTQVLAKDDLGWAGNDPNDVQIIEYDSDPDPAPENKLYRALWTHHNQNNWPAAIKIRFTITDDALPEEFRGQAYEVICPVGR